MEKLYERKIQKVTIEWSIIGGPSASFVRFTNNSGDDEYWEALENGDFSPSYFVAAGVGLDVVFPGGQGKWSFNNEIILTSYKVEVTGANRTYIKVGVDNETVQKKASDETI